MTMKRLITFSLFLTACQTTYRTDYYPPTTLTCTVGVNGRLVNTKQYFPALTETTKR